MNNELESVAICNCNFKYCPRICLGGTEENYHEELVSS
jgi:hypothetical protein